MESTHAAMSVPYPRFFVAGIRNHVLSVGFYLRVEERRRFELITSDRDRASYEENQSNKQTPGPIYGEHSSGS